VWTPGLVWTFWRRDKSGASAGIRTPGRPASSVFNVLTTVSQLQR